MPKSINPASLDLSWAHPEHLTTQLGKLLELDPFVLIPEHQVATQNVPDDCRLFPIIPRRYHLLTVHNVSYQKLAIVRDVLSQHLNLYQSNALYAHDNQLLRQEVNLVFKINKDLTDDLTGIESAFAQLGSSIRYAILSTQTSILNAGIREQALEVCRRRLKLQKEFSLVVGEGELFAIRSEGIAGIFESDVPFSETLKGLIRLKVSWLGMQHRQRRLVEGLLELQEAYQENNFDFTHLDGHDMPDDPDLNQGYRQLQMRFHTLLKQAITDSLTTAFNRNKVNEILEELTLKEQGVFSVILFDIDHFKKINDTFGHQEGDRVLVECVQETRKYLRQTDILARWGGEEFLIVMENSSLDNAFKRTEELRICIANHSFFPHHQVTCSYGVTQWLRGDAPATTIEKADQALYYAKHHGRNCVMSYELIPYQQSAG